MGSGHSIFVSYNAADGDVKELGYNPRGTPDYEEEISRILSNHTVVRNRTSERKDLKDMSEQEILDTLDGEMAGTDVTILLITPNMAVPDLPEREQWIPWEILYSMNPEVRKVKNVNRSAVLAVVVPDKDGSYDHGFVKGSNRDIVTDGLFPIVKGNMLNLSEPKTNMRGDIMVTEESSFIPIIKWNYFHSNADHYVDVAWEHRRNEDMYDLVTELE